MIKYQDKYFKYKKKYLDLKGGGTIENELSKLSKLFKVDQQKIDQLDIEIKDLETKKEDLETKKYEEIKTELNNKSYDEMTNDAKLQFQINKLDNEIKSIKTQMVQLKNAMKENETELQSKTTQLKTQLQTDVIKQITRDLHKKKIEKENIENNKTGVCVTDVSKSDEETFNECLKEFKTLCDKEANTYHTFKFKGYTIYRNGVEDEGKGRDKEWCVTIDDEPNKTPDEIDIKSYKEFYYIIKKKYNDTQLVPPNKPGLSYRRLNPFSKK